MMPTATTSTRFLALGDSYTIGESVRESERWPVQLAVGLRERGIAIDLPRIVATTGWTTDELSAAMDNSAFEPPYALVTLLIGVNNQFRGRGLDEYRTQFSALFARAIALAGNDASRVIVVAIPDWGVTPYGRGSGRDTAQIARELDAFNSAALAIAMQQHAAFVDIADLSRPHGDQNAFDRILIAGDGLHPSAAMYTRWVESILPVAEARLRRDAAPAR
jgi:lysophospholipase L1-like esterase